MNKYPLIKFVIFFICGIIFQSITNINFSVLLVVLITLLIFSVLTFIPTNSNFKLFGNYLIMMSVIIFGSIYFSFSKVSNVKYPFQNPKIKNVTVDGKVIDIELIEKNKLTFTIKAEYISLLNRNPVKKFNILVNLYDSGNHIKSIYSKLKIGNAIELEGTLFRPRDERNPGEFDYEKYLASKNIAAQFSIYDAGNVNIIDQNISFIPNIIFQSRKYLDEMITKLHNNSTSALLRGLLLADRGMIDRDIKDQFVNAGVIHVLAVSGLHVGFIVLIFIFLFKRINVFVRYIITITGLILFLLITNMPASVTRATIMALAMIAAPLTGRSYNSINSLALAAFLILLFDPNQLFTPGFQLSFSAVLSIVLLYPPISNFIKEKKINSNIIKYILLFLALSFAAQIGTLPFTLSYFHRLSIISLLANFFVIPVIGLIVGLGILTLFVGAFSIALGSVFASTNELLCYVLYNFVHIIGNPKISFVSIYNFTLYDSIIFYVIIGMLFYLWNKFKLNSARLIFVILIIFTGFVWAKLDNRNILPSNKFSVLAIDVGQGDSFLLKYPNGKTALIDAGDATPNFDIGENVIAPLLDRFGIDKIDYGFISHVDADHYRGFLYLVSRGKIKQIYKPKIDSSVSKDVALENYIRHYGVSIHYYSKRILKVDNTRIYVLNDTTQTLFSSLDTNDKSGMLKIVYGNNSFLFTGDAEAKAEKYYVQNYSGFLHSDVLKAGHHGSKTSSSNSFLNFVNPQIAIISCGIANKFHHPSPITLEKFNERKIKVYRTDLSGAVLLESDGSQIRNINWKKEESGFIF